MKKLIQYFLTSFLGIVLFYLGCYAVDKGQSSSKDYISFCQMLFGIASIMGSLFPIIYPIYKMVSEIDEI